MKILYVTTISNTVNAFLIPHIKMLIDQGHQVDVAFNIEQEVKQEIIDMGCRIHKIPFQRSPVSKDNYRGYKLLRQIILAEEYDLVHTHTPIASACVRLACRKNTNVKVIYTAHGFHFFKGAPFINWLIYYPIEKWLAKYTDILITINKEDYARANKSFKVGRVEYVPGVGIDTKRFSEVIIDKLEKRRVLGIPGGAFVMLSVGELNKNKNHEVVIKALAKTNDHKIHYLICGQGGLEDYIKKLSNELGIEKQVHLLGFRKDIPEICKLSDVFVFPSFREGLSAALMEAMACGMPVICSDIRGNSDLIEDDKGGYLIKPEDVGEYEKAIGRLIVDKPLRDMYSEYNYNKIKEYSIENITNQMEHIYYR